MGSPRCLLMLVAALALAVTSAAGQGQVKRSLDKGAEVKAAGAKRAADAGAAPSKKAPAAEVQQKAGPAARKAATTAGRQPAATSGRQPAGTSGRPAAGTATRRDPFVTPISKTASKTDQPACAGPGKRSLLLGQTALRGVARTPGGMIAVVTTSGNRTYFLRENDQVCNGRVVKVSEDSLVYEENLLDALGRVKKAEQVMKIPPEK